MNISQDRDTLVDVHHIIINLKATVVQSFKRSRAHAEIRLTPLLCARLLEATLDMAFSCGPSSQRNLFFALFLVAVMMQNRFGRALIQAGAKRRIALANPGARASGCAFVSNCQIRKDPTSIDNRRHKCLVIKSHSREGRSTSSRLFSSEATNDFFVEPSFDTIGIKSPVLLERLKQLGFTNPTVVQAESFDAIQSGSGDVTVGAETGSGKTLAYLLPLIDNILQEKEASEDGLSTYDYARAIILVPNKELVQQILRMAVPLCGGSQNAVIWSGGNTVEWDDESSGSSSDVDPKTVVRLAVMPGGLVEPLDFKPFRDSVGLGGDKPPIDLIITTPAAIGPLALSPKHIDMFADIQTVVIDEADMLLDGGYLRPLENVLMGFRRADRLDPEFGAKKTQHVFCAATLPDFGLKSVDAFLQKKFPRAERIKLAGMHNARHYGLKEPTQWNQVESKKERMEELVRLLQTSTDDGGLKDEKVMVFLNSVEDVEGAHAALERAGVLSVPYHAKIPLAERAASLDKFRRYSNDNSSDEKDTRSILVCTDLAARGLDVPGVNAVVQLQFAGNVVAHLHRMGRCGRAGQRTGRGIVFYDEQESALVQVVREAEEQQEQMVLHGDVEELNLEEDAGKVAKAFSRKRGFTKKRKKERRERT